MTKRPRRIRAARRGARKEAARRLSRPGRTLRLLVAVDFSPSSDLALQAARRMARMIGAATTVMHVRPSSDLRAAVEEDRGDLVRLSRSELRRGLDAHYRMRLAAAGARIGHARTRLVRGWPPSAISREAARGYDLIVVGSRGRGAVRRALLGSTAEELLHRARIPVLVVGARSRPA